MTRDDITVEHHPSCTTLWWSDDEGYLCHERFIFYTDNEAVEEVLARHGGTA